MSVGGGTSVGAAYDSDGNAFEIEYMDAMPGHVYRVYWGGSKEQVGKDIQGTRRVEELGGIDAENMMRQALDADWADEREAQPKGEGEAQE